MSFFKDTGPIEGTKRPDFPDRIERPHIPRNDINNILLSRLQDIIDSRTKNGGMIPDVNRIKNGEFTDPPEGIDYPKYLKKGDNGKIYDKENNRAYDSVTDWVKAQETKMKQYESSVQYCENKFKQEWVRFENAENETEKRERYSICQRYCDHIKEYRKEAAKIREKLNSVKGIDEALSSEDSETKTEGLTQEEKERIKEETGWSDEIIDGIQNMKQYEILKNAGLFETEINGRKCLIKENIDLDYTDKDGVSNRERIARGLAPLDSKTGKPIELHHLGQKADSPLIELTEEEHRTGEYEDDKKNQSLWHDNAKETEVHGEGNSWDQERKDHWKARSEESEG